MIKKIGRFIYEYWGYIIISAFFILTITYLIFAGDNIYITVNDNLYSGSVVKTKI